MEMGALDGKTHTNTGNYEMALGWNGILIEASPGNYAALPKNRPNQVWQ
jgi:hypothetical protein